MDDSVVNHLIERLVHEHKSEPADLEKSRSEISTFEARYGFALNDDLKAFYEQCYSANLFDYAFAFVPCSQIVPAGKRIFGDEDGLPPSWFAICNRGNGDWIGIDLGHPVEGTYPILDLDHDDSSYNVIALCFTEFLSDVLNLGDSSLYWLEDKEKIYGRGIHHWSTRYLRKCYKHYWDSMGSEIGPEECRREGCSRLRIPLSVVCKKHHFEMLHRFDFETKDDLPARALYEETRPWTLS